MCQGEGLRPDTCADILRAQSPAPEDEAPVPTVYGLGWVIADLGGATLAGHGEDNNEYRAFAGFIRESGDGLVVQTNGCNGRAVIDAVAVPPPTPPEESSQRPALRSNETR